MNEAPGQLSTPLIERFAASKPLRTGSLIVSIFGDSVAPRGGVVWLGSLIEALAPLGVSHRLVRTAVFRLVQDGILDNEQVGRRSYYRLTPAGRRRFDEATQRIYAQPSCRWDGSWCLIVTSLLNAEQKVSLRKDLAWLGFGQFGADLMAHPHPDQDALARHLDALEVRDRCVVMRGTDDELPSAALGQLVANAWDLPRLEAAYEAFVTAFQATLEAARHADGGIDAADAFYVRTFLIHEYRRTLLRDPALPAPLLPPGWTGQAAFQLSQELYRLVAGPSEAFLDEHFENRTGPLPPPSAAFFARFGGLTDGG
jgi:phenylacetic acid degradation operon negative regulatory protein